MKFLPRKVIFMAKLTDENVAKHHVKKITIGKVARCEFNNFSLFVFLSDVGFSIEI